MFKLACFMMLLTSFTLVACGGTSSSSPPEAALTQGPLLPMPDERPARITR